MVDDLKPYLAYKDSGVPWLGDVPEHWEVKRNKLFLREVDERSADGSEELLTVSQYTGVTPRRERLSEDGDLLTHAASLIGYKRVSPGDLVMNIMLAWNGSLGVSPVAGIASPAYCVFRAKADVEPRFLHFLLRTPLFTGVFKTVSTGVVDSRLRLYPDVFLRLPAALPPPAEQAAIVRFLDHAGRRIRRYIRAKHKLIKLLEEQKQAIIHRSVTRGLDPNVALKPSGVQWLGDVPEHWEVIPLKFLCHRIQNGATPPTSEQRYYENGTVPWFGPSSVGTASELGAPVRYLVAVAFSDGKARLINGPAILVIVIGATAGKMGLLVGEGATNQQITAFELREDKIVPEFGIHQLRSSENWLKSTASTATIPILDSSIVNRLPVAFPPPGEQQAILSAISDQTSPLATAISRLEREIALLREYRTRLIADVVTGKLDVRAAAASLPDEADELEALDDTAALAEGEDITDGDLNAPPEEVEA